MFQLIPLGVGGLGSSSATFQCQDSTAGQALSLSRASATRWLASPPASRNGSSAIVIESTPYIFLGVSDVMQRATVGWFVGP